MIIEKPQEYNVELEEKEETIITKCVLLLSNLRDEMYDRDCSELVCGFTVIDDSILEDIINDLTAISKIDKIRFN